MTDILEELRKKKDQLKTQRALAAWLGIRESYVSDLLSGRVPMTKTVAYKLGWEKVTVWRKRKPSETAVAVRT